MKVGHKSDIGSRKAIYEDSIVVMKSNTVYRSKHVEAILLALADGMGGHNAGGVASSLATETITEEMTRVLEKGQRGLSDEEMSTLFQKSIKLANKKIYEYGQQNPQYQGMGTTVTAAVVLENIVYIGHVGDSRAHISNEREFIQVTKDHTLVQEMVDDGKITDDEARVHPQKNILTRIVGMYPDVDADIIRVRLDEGDHLLVCSDGLTDIVPDEEIHAIVLDYKDPQTICDALVEEANERGGFDNISVILGKFDADDILIQKQKKQKTELRTIKLKSEVLTCPLCKNEIQEDWIACPYCAVRLKDDTRIY